MTKAEDLSETVAKELRVLERYRQEQEELRKLVGRHELPMVVAVERAIARRTEAYKVVKGVLSPHSNLSDDYNNTAHAQAVVKKFEARGADIVRLEAENSTLRQDKAKFKSGIAGGLGYSGVDNRSNDELVTRAYLLLQGLLDVESLRANLAMAMGYSKHAQPDDDTILDHVKTLMGDGAGLQIRLAASTGREKELYNALADITRIDDDFIVDAPECLAGKVQVKLAGHTLELDSIRSALRTVTKERAQARKERDSAHAATKAARDAANQKVNNTNAMHAEYVERSVVAHRAITKERDNANKWGDDARRAMVHIRHKLRGCGLNIGDGYDAVESALDYIIEESGNNYSSAQGLNVEIIQARNDMSEFDGPFIHTTLDGAVKHAEKTITDLQVSVEKLQSDFTDVANSELDVVLGCCTHGFCPDCEHNDVDCDDEPCNKCFKVGDRDPSKFSKMSPVIFTIDPVEVSKPVSFVSVSEWMKAACQPNPRQQCSDCKNWTAKGRAPYSKTTGPFCQVDATAKTGDQGIDCHDFEPKDVSGPHNEPTEHELEVKRLRDEIGLLQKIKDQYSKELDAITRAAGGLRIMGGDALKRVETKMAELVMVKKELRDRPTRYTLEDVKVTIDGQDVTSAFSGPTLPMSPTFCKGCEKQLDKLQGELDAVKKTHTRDIKAYHSAIDQRNEARADIDALNAEMSKERRHLADARREHAGTRRECQVELARLQSLVESIRNANISMCCEMDDTKERAKRLDKSLQIADAALYKARRLRDEALESIETLKAGQPVFMSVDWAKAPMAMLTLSACADCDHICAPQNTEPCSTCRSNEPSNFEVSKS